MYVKCARCVCKTCFRRVFLQKSRFTCTFTCTLRADCREIIVEKSIWMHFLHLKCSKGGVKWWCRLKKCTYATYKITRYYLCWCRKYLLFAHFLHAKTTLRVIFPILPTHPLVCCIVCESQTNYVYSIVYHSAGNWSIKRHRARRKCNVSYI